MLLKIFKIIVVILVLGTAGFYLLTDSSELQISRPEQVHYMRDEQGRKLDLVGQYPVQTGATTERPGSTAPTEIYLPADRPEGEFHFEVSPARTKTTAAADAVPGGSVQ